ncbi:MAG: PASTA domain-containing protein [Oscillibacter sp.]|nr:PASTA domain-containing protein [Oscillibacter sp.]
MANQTIRTRTVWIMALLGVVTFAALFWKLYSLQILRHTEMQERAARQQTRSVTVSASRGSIYDRNGYLLAVSATAETVNISPKEILEFVERQEEDRENGKNIPRILDQTYIARGLSRILGVDQASIETRMGKTKSMYETIKKKVDREIADEVRRFINGEIDEEGNVLVEQTAEGKTVLRTDGKSSPRKLTGVWLQPDSKRYYPYSSLAANVVGFVNADNQGSVGLEAKYESELEGVSGLTVTAKNGAGPDILYQYEQYYDAQDGHDLVLTLDVTVQSYLERGISSMLDRFEAANGGTGIVMNAKTGAVLAMASYPNYDLNQYSMILDPALETKLDLTLGEIHRSDYDTEEEYEAAKKKAENAAMQSQWRNKNIDSTYEPGSTFKPVTLSAALEEGLVTPETTFTCTGSIMVPGWSRPFYCSNHSGHGVQDLKTATGNSCNPAFITMGRMIGTETYYKYLQSFGLMERTNIDMIGEVSGIFANEKSFNSNEVSLASYAFGQTFNVTPIELIRAQAACINGGYLLEPYVVDQVLDSDGNILSQHNSAPIRQVISAETSAIVRECLEHVVANGTGKNGQVPGYRIGGKTGTADKTLTRVDGQKPDLVVSFMCFAPADDPQYIMLITMDTPSRDTGTYPSGGQMVAPAASQIMADILPYLGVKPDYADEAGVEAPVLNVIGKTLAEAQKTLEPVGFSIRTVGDGETVTDQVPAGGAVVPANAQIILYMGEEKPNRLSTVPNVIGMDADRANTALTEAGLILKITGAASGSAVAISQDETPGSGVKPGTVVTVRFGDTSVLD